MTAFTRCLLLLLFIVIGIVFAISFGAIFYKLRKDKDDQISKSGSIKNIIIPSIFFWVTIGILIIIKIEYSIPLQLFILSGIILASFLSAISSKKAWIFFLCFGVIVLELGLEALIRKFVEWVNCTNEKRKAKILAEAASKLIAPPEPSAPPIRNLSPENQANILKLNQPSAPPLENNSMQPSAPPLENNSMQPSAPPLNNSLKPSAPPLNKP